MPTPEFIPAKITRDQFVDAVKPLLDLLGVDAMQILDEIHIHNGRISFTLVAPADGAALPPQFPFTEGDAREFTEYGIPVSVEVVG